MVSAGDAAWEDVGRPKRLRRETDHHALGVAVSRVSRYF
jgi:hypothetical protein